MSKVKKRLLEELYNLNSERLKKSKDIDAPNEYVEAAVLIDSQIHNRLTEIREDIGLDTSGVDTIMIIWGLLVGIGHLSISQFFKCLEVCGVEIEE